MRECCVYWLATWLIRLLIDELEMWQQLMFSACAHLKYRLKINNIISRVSEFFDFIFLHII